MTSYTYDIRITGLLGPAASEAFADMMMKVEPCITVLSGDLNQRGLHAVLDRVRALGLELIEIKQATPEYGVSSSCSSDASTRQARNRKTECG